MTADQMKVILTDSLLNQQKNFGLRNFAEQQYKNIQNNLRHYQIIWYNPSEEDEKNLRLFKKNGLWTAKQIMDFESLK